MSKLAGWLLLFIVLLSLAFNTSWGGPLIFVGLIPLFIFIDKARSKHWSSKRIVRYVWIAGLIFNLAVLFWFNQFELESAQATNSIQFKLLMVAEWFFVSLVGSIGIFLAIYLITKFKIKLFKISTIFYIPAIWALSEFIRSYLSSIVWWHPEALIGAIWNTGALGFAIGVTPLGHLAAVGGIYTASFLVVMINISIFWIIKKRNNLVAIGVISAILLLNGIMYLAYSKPNGQAIKVGLVQDKEFALITTNELKNVIDKERKYSNYDSVILPEYSFFFRNPNGNVQTDIFDNLFKKRPGVLISAGGQDIFLKNDVSKKTSKIVYRNEKGEIIDVQEKNFLIALGEYLPSIYQSLAKVTGNQSAIEKYEQNRQTLEKGKLPEKPVEYNGISYGALSCSGTISPFLYKNLAYDGAQVLISSSSLGTLDQSPLVLIQSEQYIRFTTLATARPYLQATKGGNSYIIDSNGMIQLKNWASDLELISDEVLTNKKKTPYVMFGEIGLPISLFIVVFMLFKTYRPSKSDRFGK